MTYSESELPTLAHLLETLTAIAGCEEAVTPETSIAEAAVDSLTIVEWLFTLEADYGLVPPDEFYDMPDKLTFGELYIALLASRS